jgi:hypothetical protein
MVKVSSAAAARATGIRNSRSTAATSARLSRPASNLLLRRNACHCFTLSACSQNAAVSASGGAAGIGVRRRSNVARSAWHSNGPRNEPCRAIAHRS